MDQQYAEQIKAYLPQTIRDSFKRDASELCPFVQTMLHDCTPDTPAFERNYAELEAYYKSISTPTAAEPVPYYKLYSGNRAQKVSFDQRLRPDPSDITDFFLSFARGAQFVADEYKENPPIEHVLVVQPERYELIRGRKAINPNDNAMCYIMQGEYTPAPGAAPEKIENTLMINAGYIYDAKVRWAKGIATRNEMTPQAAALGYLKQEDTLTCAGIEECDHAYWLAHPEKFPEKFGMTFYEYASGTRRDQLADYGSDPLEKSAAEMKHKAKKELQFSSVRIG